MNSYLRGFSVKLSESDRKSIIEGYTNVVTRISDIDYQKRVWIRGEGPECDDFDETTCQFFDISDPILEDSENFNFPQPQLILLKAFSDNYRKFSEENYWPPEFIDTPEWDRITKMAKEVLKSFNCVQDP